MSELEKKAKTGNFIKDLALRYDSANKHLWVMLEDALVPEKKLEELKQKLKEWFMELGGWLMSSEVRSKLRGWNKLDLPKEMKEKFEELLKEVKEA